MALCAAAPLWLPGPAVAAVVVPPGFENRQLAVLDIPTGLAFTPDGRLLITTKNGGLRVYEDEVLRATPAIDLGSRLCTNAEQGLSGVAVGPDFADSQYIYLYYTYDRGTDSCGTDPAQLDETGVNRVSRFVLGDGSVIDPSSETVLIDNIPSPSGIHNAGDLHFGKDGYLYVTTGDGGCDFTLASGCGPWNNAARYTNALTGKVLRIASDGGIPPDNPYVGPGTARCNEAGRTTPGTWCQEIYATGLRNPFRFAFDEDASSTRFFVNDVGQADWEEVDRGQSGADYGWNVREGPCVVRSTTDCGPPPAGMTNPIFSYGHTTGCTSVTGGAFVPRGAWPNAYDGGYLFGDYICRKIFVLVEETSGEYSAAEFASGLGRPTALAFGPNGSDRALYYVSTEGPHGLNRITYTGEANRTPLAVAQASPTHGTLPLDVSLDAGGSSDPDGDELAYEWDFGDGSPLETGATAAHRYETAGIYTARLEVTDTEGATDIDTVRIDAGNLPPEPSIDAPAPDERFAVGESFTLTGSATDPEDGPLAGTALSWEVVKHHATHEHPFLPPTSGSEASITAPHPEDFASTTNSYLEIRLTATDSKGLSKTVSQDLRPQLADVDLATEPAGLRLEVNGTTAPASVTSWEGWELELNAPHPQWDGSGTGYTFRSWSDGGAQRHTIATPGADATYTAVFTSRYTRPKAARAVHVAVVPAYRRCEGPNRIHGPPLEEPACHPPVQETSFTTVGTPDANGLSAQSVGYVALKVLTGNSATAENEADVRIRLHLTDVVDRGADYYVGDVMAQALVRLTDGQNGTSGRDSGTTEELPVSVTARCVPDVAVGGSTCQAQTTMNALVPGAVREGQRAIWELGALQVFDGGEDGEVATPDNGLLATQGVFVP